MSKQALNQLEQDLREQLRLSEKELAGLEASLKAVDDELVVLRRQQEQYDKLEAVCTGLEELDAMGAGHLFWDTESNENAGARLEHARWEIGKYHEAVVEVETRKETILEDIEQQNVELDYLHYDLQDIIEQEEARDNEWVVEREDDDAVPAHIQVMPWARGCEEDRRFQRSLGSSLATAAALILMVGMIAIPIKEREQEIELPERVAKLVRQERQLPPPPPMPEPEVPEEQPEPEPEPELVEELPDEPLPVSNDEPQLAQEQQPDTREQVKSKGILAFRDSFASRADIKPSAQLGLDASISDAGAAESGRPERMMVTTTAPGSSGGINLADYSRDFGGGGDGSGGGMAGVAVSRVASSIGGGDGPNRPLAGGASAGRTDEEIQIVFDRYKAALYRLYNRELRKDPTLRGQLVLRLTIEPDGSVSMCELHSGSMNAPELAAQVVGRVKTFDFGAKEDIVAVTIIYPIDFLPAA